MQALAAQELLPVEIIIAGVTDAFEQVPGVQLIQMPDEAESGSLGALRNRAFAHSEGDAIVFIDDDVLFPPTWLKRLLDYSTNTDWDWLANPILSPQGDRYWDRATRVPHRLTHYDHDPADPNLYQTGCFSIFKRQVCQQYLWDAELPFYAEKKGYAENEDLEYSRRLFAAGYRLDFDPHNLVWHADSNYVQVTLKHGDAVTDHLANLDGETRGKLASRPLHPDFPPI